MKNQIVKKGLRFVLLGCVGIAVVGTFVFLWKKAQPVKTTYQIVQPSTGDIATKTVATGNVEPRHEVEIKPQISGIIAYGSERRNHRRHQGYSRDGSVE